MTDRHNTRDLVRAMFATGPVPDMPEIPARDELAALDEAAFKARIAEIAAAFRSPHLNVERPRDVREEYRFGFFQRGATRSRGIQLSWSDQHFGGKRPWFVCPGCGFRCALLFEGRCRRCAGVRYRSSRDPELAAIRARSLHLRAELRNGGALLSPPPSRPIRMTLARYTRLVTELEAVEIQALQRLAPESPGMQRQLAARFENARQWAALQMRRRIPTRSR